MPKRAIQSADVFEAKGALYTPAIEAIGGRTVYIAGQVGRDKDGKTVPGDVREQTRLTMENIRALLAAAGGTFADVVKTTVYVTDIRYSDAIREVRRQFMTPPYPASTFVQVSALAGPEYMIEIEAIAVVG